MKMCVIFILCRFYHKPAISVAKKICLPCVALPNQNYSSITFSVKYEHDISLFHVSFSLNVCLFTDKRIANLITLLYQLPFPPSLARRHRYQPPVPAVTLNLLNVKCHLIKQSLSTLPRDTIQNSSSTKKPDA